MPDALPVVVVLDSGVVPSAADRVNWSFVKARPLGRFFLMVSVEGELQLARSVLAQLTSIFWFDPIGFQVLGSYRASVEPLPR